MNWGWADVLVLLLCVLQVGLLVAILVALLRIKNGPLARLADSVSSLARSGKALADAGQGAVEKSQGHVVGIAGSVTRIVAALRPTPTPEGLRVGYADLRRWFTALLTLEATLEQMRAQFTPRAAPPGPPAASAGSGGARTRRRRLRASDFTAASLAARAGLIPPIFHRIAPLLGVARIALGAYRAAAGARRETPPPGP